MLSMAKYYPAFINLDGRKCIVVGGGRVAERKIKGLTACGADVVVVAAKVTPWIRRAAGSIRRIHLVRRYSITCLKGALIIFAATDNAAMNRRISRDAQRLGILINIADDPEHCNFILPSVLRRGDLSIAVSTSGVSPGLAVSLRKYFERIFGREYGIMLRKVGKLRKLLKKNTEDKSERMRIMSGLPYEKMIWHLKNKGERAMAQVISGHIKRKYNLSILL